MIIFHEGLPRSGKSYEAIVKQVIEYLKAGRQCFCFVDGLNFEKFASITDIEIDKLKGRVVKTPITLNERANHRYILRENNQYYAIDYQGLLFQIEEEQVLTIHDHVADDSFVVIDEIQDYFPASNRKLDQGITKFVTQHGHRGIDILIMGQAHEDCHNLWKRRIDKLVSFEKRDVVGREHEYTWRMYKQKKDGKNYKFVKVSSGKGVYDKQYFGLYKSHVDGVENKGNHYDERANLFKTSAFTVYLPIFGGVLVFAIYFLVSFFSGDVKVGGEVQAAPLKQTPATQQPANLQRVRTAAVETKPEVIRVTTDNSESNYLATILNRYRPRLAGVIENKHKMVAYVEFLDDSFHVKEMLELKQIVDLGWDYKRIGYGFKLYRGKQEVVVTAWPLDSVGKVSNHTRQQL